MKAIIKTALEKATVDFLEIRVEETYETSLSFRGKSLNNFQQTHDYGGYVRAMGKQGWGFVSFNRLEELPGHVSTACRQAEAVGGPRTEPAPAPVIQDEIKLDIPSDKDPRKIPVEEKMKLMERFSGTLLDYSDKIVTSRAGYNEFYRRYTVANTEGTFIDTEALWAAGGTAAVGRDGSVVESLHKGFGTRNDWNDILKAEEDLEKLAADTVDLLKAEPAKGGRYTVILDPRLAGVFVHEAFGHLSEADHIAENEALAKQMKLGKRFGQDILNIKDGAILKDERGSYAYDDEGVPASMTYLIKDGLLSGYLHSRQTAAMLGHKPTGNARTINYQFPPICRQSNVFIDEGESEFDEMLDGIEEGLYVVGGGSGNTSTGLFTFSAERARKIKNGDLGPYVRDFVLTGNVFDTLMNIDKIGSDLHRARSGYCGKSYGQRMQYPLMVSMGSPHIRIQNVLIGGR